MPHAFRIGIVPACPVHSGVLKRYEGRHGAEGVCELLVKRLIKVFVQRRNGHQAKVVERRQRLGYRGDAREETHTDDSVEDGDIGR